MFGNRSPELAPKMLHTHAFSRAACDHLLKYENNVLHQVFRHASFHLLLERPWVVKMSSHGRPRKFRHCHGPLHAGCQRTDLDFVMYLDDDSYLNVPRLLSLLEVR